MKWYTIAEKKPNEEHEKYPYSSLIVVVNSDMAFYLAVAFLKKLSPKDIEYAVFCEKDGERIPYEDIQCWCIFEHGPLAVPEEK